MPKKAFAIAAHPDDIEFMMAGTLALLRQAGFEIHYMNLANGSLGTNRHGHDEIVALRRQESLDACAKLGAVHHESLVDDIEIFYERDTLFRLASVVRQVAPDILLTQHPEDYMEDHTNTARLAVTAAFCRGMTNFKAIPPVPAVAGDIAVYHALPYPLQTPMRQPVKAGLYVDVTPVMGLKTTALACHRSQKEWLDVSQGMDSYLITMDNLCRDIGAMSGKFARAEGWTRHHHLGFTAVDCDPLAEALGKAATA